MKRLMTATAVVALLVGAAVAQQSPPSTGSSTGSSSTTQMTTPPPAGSNTGATTTTTTTAPAPSSSASTATPPAGMNFVTQQTDKQWLASDIIGATVYGPQDANIGSVNDLLTGDDGKVVAAVIGVGGFLGIGQKNVAVNFENLQKSMTPRGDIKLSLAATADQLKAAPDFKTMKDLNRAQTATSSPATGSSSTTAPATPATPAR